MLTDTEVNKLTINGGRSVFFYIMLCGLADMYWHLFGAAPVIMVEELYSIKDGGSKYIPLGDISLLPLWELPVW